jgi:hypothetical protein
LFGFQCVRVCVHISIVYALCASKLLIYFHSSKNLPIFFCNILCKLAPLPKTACLQVIQIPFVFVAFALEGDVLVRIPMREPTEAVAYIIKGVEYVEKDDQEFRLLSKVYALVVDKYAVTRRAAFLFGVAEYDEGPHGDAGVVP